MKRKLKPLGTEAYVHIEDIKIPPDFTISHPSKWKIKKYTNRYVKLGYLDEPLSVVPETNEDGHPNKLLLVNGYIRYLIAKDWNFDLVPVKYIDINDLIIE